MSLDDILGTLPGYAELSPKLKEAMLDSSLMPDSQGRSPQDKGYIRTEDVFFAALALVPLLRALPQVTSASSEGASVKTEPPDWGAMERYLRSHSPIMQGMTSVFGVIEIPYSRAHRLALFKEDHDIDTDVG